MVESIEFRNPFVKVWAEQYKEDEFNAHFSEFIIPLIPQFFDYPNIFLYGGSGTGKTMLLRYLSFEVQKSHFEQKTGEIQDIKTFFEFSSAEIKKVLNKRIKCLGIYCKLTEIPSSLFSNKCRDKQEEKFLFKIYLDLEISTKFIMSISELIKNCCDNKKNEMIKLKILECVKKCSDINEKAEFSNILEFLSSKKKQIDLYLSSLLINKTILFRSEIQEFKVSGPVRLFFNLAEVLKTQIEEFSDVNIYVLLDEYERIEDHYKLLINTLIRERNKFLGFKISSRRYGLSTFQTLNPDDFIIIGRDAELIDLEIILRGKENKAKYRRLLIDVAKKRLESEQYFVEKNLTDIKKLLKSITPEEEAKNLIVNKNGELEHRARFKKFLKTYGEKDIEKTMNLIKCEENPLIEKLNMLLIKRRIIYANKGIKNNRKYSNAEISEMAEEFIKNPTKRTPYYYLYEKNKVALLFQLLNEYRKNKVYAGFDVFTALSGGFTAWFLELCYGAVEFAKEFFLLSNSFEIGINAQRRAAEKVAWGFLDGVVRNIERVGTDLYYFTLNTGAFLRSLHLDELIKEPEPTYFNTKTAELKKNYRDVIKIAHSWSVLQTKTPMKPKQTGEPLPEVHILHPILAPMFQISYRTRGRTNLLPEEVELLISGFEGDVKKLVIKYKWEKGKQKRGKYEQKELFQLDNVL